MAGTGFEPVKAYAGEFTVRSLWPLGHPAMKLARDYLTRRAATDTKSKRVLVRAPGFGTGCCTGLKEVGERRGVVIVLFDVTADLLGTKVLFAYG